MSDKKFWVSFKRFLIGPVPVQQDRMTRWAEEANYDCLVEIMDNCFDHKIDFKSWEPFEFLNTVEETLNGEPQVIEMVHSETLYATKDLEANRAEIIQLLKSLGRLK